ncbi:unnamed protein product, partial [Pocillopora meandrina]
SCHGCQAVSKYSASEPMVQAYPPSGPWQDCTADILGPLSSGENLVLLLQFYDSRYFEVVILKSTTSTKKYQENGATESESVVPRQPTASPLEPATPFLPITSQPIASQPIASQPIVSQPIASQPIASPISMQQIVNPSSPMLKTSQRPTRMIRIPKQVEDYELSKA